MKIQLIIKDSHGNAIAKHALQPGQSLAVESKPQAASYEVHTIDGQPPRKIVASNANGKMKFTLVDDATGEQYDIVLQNVSAEEMPAITASGPDDVVYAYDYDAAEGAYELVSTSSDPLVADNAYVAGGVLGGLAALIGTAAATRSGGSSSKNRHSGASGDQDAASAAPGTTPSLVDDAGNPVAGGTTSDSTPTIGGDGMKPGSTVEIKDGDTVIGEAIADDDGSWTFTPDKPLPDGDHKLVIDGTDADGNKVSDSVDVIIDTTPDANDDNGTPGQDDADSTTPDATDDNGTSGQDDAGSTTPDANGDNGTPGQDDAGSTTPDTDDGAGKTKPGLTDDAGNPIADGTTTSDSTPTVGGDGMQPGSTVEIKDGDTVIGEAIADDEGKWTFTPDKPLPDGDHKLVIDGTDAEGNKVEETVDITIDTIPDTSDDAGTPGQDDADSTTPDTNDDNGTPGQDDAGSTKPDSDDDAGKTTPGLTDDAGNPIAGGGTTSDSTPTVGGGGMKPGSTVEIKDGDTVIGEATADDDGSWTFTPDKPLPDGDHQLVIDGTDADGNKVEETVDITIDTTPDTSDDTGTPGQDDAGSTTPDSDDDAGKTKPGLTDDAGNPIADGTTTSDSTPTVGGGGMQPGSTVEIKDGDTVIGEAIADDDGSWTFTPDKPLPDGDHQLVIDGTDAEGNKVEETVDITIDTTPDTSDDNGTPGQDDADSTTPDSDDDAGKTKPGLTDDAGNPIADSGTTSDSTPTVGGDGMQPGSTIEIKDGDTVIGEAIADDNGSWTFTPDKPLPDGDHQLVIDGTDADGNQVEETVDITIDTTPDATDDNGTPGQDDAGSTKPDTDDDAGKTTPGLTDDAGNPIADGGTTSDSTPTVGGGGMQPGSTVEIKDGDTVIGEATADDDGKWTFTSDKPLPDGDHKLVIDGTDAEGNKVSDTINVVIQTSPSMEIVDDNGNAILDGETTSDSTPTFNGKNFASGTTIVITDGETTLASLTPGKEGSWTFTPDAALTDGAHVISVTVTTPQGVSKSGRFNVTIDTTPPEGVDINSVTIVDNDGNAITAESITVDNTPSFSGKGLEPGATVIVRDGETVLGETIVNEDGSWSFTPPAALDDGEHQFTFEVTDEVGNSSGISDEIDLSVSAAKGINTGVVMTDDAGNVIVNGDATNDSTPAFSGKDQKPGTTITLADGDTILGKVDVAEDGSWSFTPDAPLAEGEHTLTVTVTDPAGNASSDTIKVVVDTIAPEVIDVNTVVVSDDAGHVFAAGSAISDTTPTFSASGQEAGTTIIVRDSGTVLGEAQVAEDGSWSFTPSEALADGDHSFTFETVDPAGNSSGESATIRYVVDSVAPDGVDIAKVVITDEVGSVVSAVDTQSDSKLTFSGNDLEPGATVTMHDNGQIVGTTTVAKDGSWTLTATDGLYDGSHGVSFTVTDAAGNSSDPSGTLDLNVQTIVLTASDNISSGAAVGFDYPVDVNEDLGTVIQDGGLIAFNNRIVSDPIVVNDGTIIDLNVTATSSAFLNVASNSSLVLQKFDSSTSTWVTVSEENSGNLFGMFGLGTSSSTITLSGLTAGQYQLVYTTNGMNVGVSFSLDASKTVYTLAEQGTPTDYTTATGNVITDIDPVYGSDGIPHIAYTSVSAVSVNNSDGTVTSATLDATTRTATLVGQYGTLVINADGSYIYTPVSSMDSIGKVDSFTYTLTDSATGQSASAQIHVQVGTTNSALDLSWDPTDPTASAITDIASSNEADASVTVVYSKTSDTMPELLLTEESGPVYTHSFTLNAADDIVTGEFKLSTQYDFWGNNFSQDMTLVYAVQKQGEDGSWSTVSAQQLLVTAGNHSDEVLLYTDISSLVSEAGTYRIAVSSTGATNTIRVNMDVEVLSTTDYVITTNEVATGNILTDEGTDGAVDKLSSIYTRIYAKAGDSTSDVAIDESYTWVTESGVKIEGEYGTLLIYNNGAYTYTPDTTTLPSGSEDLFTYALKGANGKVVNATITIHLGVEVNGSDGGALVFHGTEADDVFDVYDTQFASVNGEAGNDTLAWHGEGQLVLSDVAAKVSNIESIMLTSTTSSDNLVLDAQSVEKVTSENNALYIKGIAGDSVTLEGTWVNSGTVIVDNVSWTHYRSTTAEGAGVDIYVQQGLRLSSATYTDSQNGTAFTVTAEQEVTGTASGDIFNVSDTGFTHIDGGEGLDTLVWSGTGTLTLSELQSKLSNIEEIALVNDSVVNTLVVTAQSVAEITDANNTLFVKGAITDRLTLSGSWTLSGSEVVNNVDYVHYVSTSADGQTVNLYVDRDIKLSSTETASEHDAADVTGDVALLSDSVAQSTTMNAATSSFTSESFTINSLSDLQEINVSVNGPSIDAGNRVSVNWSLQVYNAQTLRWDNVTHGTQVLTSDSPLNVSLAGQNAGTWRIVVDSTQSGHPGFLWATIFDDLTVKVAVNIVSTTDYKVSTSSSVNGSVFTSDSASDGALLVKSISAGIVTGAASYTLVTAAGTTIAGTYGTLTIKNDGSYSYTLNSGSVIKLTGSEDSFTYILANGTTKNLVMTLGVSVDGAEGGALIFAGTVGDDRFTVHDTLFTSVDGKSGQDTLVWNGKGELNLSDVADKVNNIEIIDLQDNAQATALLLSADDIEKITDAGNALYVRGGSNDTLSLQGVWTISGVETLNNLTYTLYTSTALDGTTIKLYVQQGLHFNEVTEHVEGAITDVSADLTVVSVSQNGETAAITDGAVSVKGAFGTLVIDEAGHYSYVADDAYAHSGNTDSFTYALSDGSKASLSFNLGVDVDGSAGGEITFTGTSGADVFEVYDTSFVSINGAEGNDTLAWHGTGTLNLSDISARVNNIETIDLMKDAGKDNLVVSAESLLKVTDNDNTLYVRGENGDTVTLKGHWDQADGLVANGVNYNHYTSSAADGSVVQLYIEDDVTIG